MKPAGIVLAILGALSLLGAILLPTVIVPNVATGVVASTDSTTYSVAKVKYLDQSKLLDAVSANDPEAAYGNAELDGTRVTRAQQDNEEAKSEGVVMFDTVSENKIAGTDEVFEPSPGGEAVFAFDPKNSELVNCCGARLGDNTDVNFSGVMPLKFPFNTPKEDLEIFNTDLQAPVTATFEETVNEFGMELYRFTQVVPATQLPGDPLLEVPLDLAKVAVGVFAPSVAPQLDSLPADQPVKLYQFTSQQNEFLVEPKTGQLVDGSLNSVNTARLDGGADDILTVAEVQGGSGDVEAGAAEIKSTADLIGNAGTLGPIVLGVLGVALLGGGGAMIAKGNKKNLAVTAGQDTARSA
jgi:hypothetical protein